MVFFEYVNHWPKILFFRVYHLWNSTAELILSTVESRQPNLYLYLYVICPFYLWLYMYVHVRLFLIVIMLKLMKRDRSFWNVFWLIIFLIFFPCLTCLFIHILPSNANNKDEYSIEIVNRSKVWPSEMKFL